MSTRFYPSRLTHWHAIAHLKSSLQICFAYPLHDWIFPYILSTYDQSHCMLYLQKRRPLSLMQFENFALQNIHIEWSCSGTEIFYRHKCSYHPRNMFLVLQRDQILKHTKIYFETLRYVSSLLICMTFNNFLVVAQRPENSSTIKVNQYYSVGNTLKQRHAYERLQNCWQPTTDLRNIRNKIQVNHFNHFSLFHLLALPHSHCSTLEEFWQGFLISRRWSR